MLFRSQGLKGTRGYVGRREGKFTIRSGSSCVGVIPPWDDQVPRQDNLPFFPGAQLRVIVPGNIVGPVK